VRGVQRSDPVPLGLRMLPALQRGPAGQPHQLGGRGVQPPPHAIGVAALVQQAQHVPQMRADQRQQRPTANLIIHSAQPTGDVVEVIDHSDRQRRTG